MNFGDGDDKLYAVGKVLDRMRELQDRSDGVAAAIKAANITGYIKDPCGCPVHEFLIKGWRPLDFGVTTVTAGQSSTQIHFTGGGLLVLDTPKLISDFIRAFDDGEYPELVRPEAGHLQLRS